MPHKELLEIRHRLKNQYINKSIFEKEIKTEDYHITFRKRFGQIKISDFVSNGKLSRSKIFEIRKKLIEYAKEKKVNKIITNTWIFYEFPKYAELLGFKLISGTEKNYMYLKNKYKIKKIIGADIDKSIIYAETQDREIIRVYVSPNIELPKYEFTIKGKEEK